MVEGRGAAWEKPGQDKVPQKDNRIKPDEVCGAGWISRQYLNIAGIKHKFYIVYFGRRRSKEWQFCIPRGGVEMPAGSKFKVEVIDTWRMTIKPVRGVFETRKKNRYCYSAKKGGR